MKQRWSERNKKILVLLGILTVMMFVAFYYSITETQRFAPVLEHYFITKAYSPSLNSLALTYFISLMIIISWTICFGVLMFRTLFPRKNSFKNALGLDYADDLKKMLIQVRKGL